MVPTMAESGADRLLPGEDPGTKDLEDVELWLQVYREMIGVKQDLITRLDGHLRGLSEPAQAELNSIDNTLMKEQVARFQRRLEFWQSRRAELASGNQEVREADAAREPRAD